MLADPQTQDDFELNRLHTETVPDVIETLKNLPADEAFGISCGDIMSDNLSLNPRYEDAVRSIGIPILPGGWNQTLMRR